MTQKQHRLAAIINERPGHVLKEIVEVYTQTGLPVGSKTIAERLPASLSPATVRNVMADLEGMGLLESPHTSAGRVPTEEGFRLYVSGMVEASQLSRALQQRFAQTAQAGSFDQVLSQASQMMAQMSGCAGLVLAPKYDADYVHQIEFVRLEGGRVLVILVAESGKVENRIIHVPPQVDQKILKDAAQRLSEVVRGQTLPQARESIVHALRKEKLALDQMMDHLLNAEAAAERALIVGGSQNLFSYPELVRDRLQGLFEVFEEKRMLIGLLDQVQAGDGVQIFIGAECPLDVARDCTMITAQYASPDKQLVGTVGVIGPMRMNYRQNIALVDYTARLLSRALENI